MLKKFIIIIIIVLAAGPFYLNSLKMPVNNNGQETIFAVNQGETVGEIALNLKKEELIKSTRYFKYLVWRGKLKILAGQYSLSQKISMENIIKILTAGDIINNEKQIRIIEGWGIKDINNYLNKNKIVEENSFIKLAEKEMNNLDFKELSEEIASTLPKNAILEGFLFPDTYRLNKDAKADEIIRKMLVNFENKLTQEMRGEIKKQNKSVFEIITMASVVEKEVRTAEDMKIVSGIFWDRIKYGMPLQADATLSYIFDDNIGGHSIEETKIDSPYNTYKYAGLPKGPIANPGLNAITAAIYPKFTGYGYFLSDPATGKTIYSKTLSEHNVNKAKYLK